MNKELLTLSYNFTYQCCGDQKFYMKKDYATNCIGLHCYKCNRWIKWVKSDEQYILKEKYKVPKI